jgi:hypothetical protein
MVARLFDQNPEQELEEDLERFAAVAERRRHVRAYYADEKRGDKDEAPPPSRGGRRGGRSKDAYIYDGKEVRPFEHGEGHAREQDKDDKRDAPDERRTHGRGRFDEELRAARHSQLDGLRRYVDERERDERRRYRDAHEARMRRAAERERSRIHVESPARYDEPPRRDEPLYRYSMTPRERARERARRREPDYDYKGKAFSRGIDKLMDDAPSTRWRR